jgi:hypothetical protein
MSCIKEKEQGAAEEGGQRLSGKDELPSKWCVL